MKVKIRKKGSEECSEIGLADFLLSVSSVSDRNDERTINIGGETYLLDTIEDICKEEKTEEVSEIVESSESTSPATDTESETTSPENNDARVSEEAITEPSNATAQ
jgi:hypothetical protein